MSHCAVRTETCVHCGCCGVHVDAKHTPFHATHSGWLNKRAPSLLRLAERVQILLPTLTTVFFCRGATNGDDGHQRARSTGQSAQTESASSAEPSGRLFQLRRAEIRDIFHQSASDGGNISRTLHTDHMVSS